MNPIEHTGLRGWNLPFKTVLLITVEVFMECINGKSSLPETKTKLWSAFFVYFIGIPYGLYPSC